MVKCSNGEPDCMSFKVLGSGILFEGGNYRAKSVSKAAKRAGVKLFQKIDNKPEYKKYASKKSIKFILGETTRGSDKKTYAFEISRVKLDKPITIGKGKNNATNDVNPFKVTYQVKYKYVCTRLSDADKEIDAIKRKADEKKKTKKLAEDYSKKPKRERKAPERLGF